MVAVSPPVAGDVETVPTEPQVAPDLDILAIRLGDAVRGRGDVLLVEYSDYECAFCQQFHGTAQALVDSGKVAWVYRHLPLPFHATAKDGAIIGECVKKHRGSDAFWIYTDGVFAAGALNLEVYKSLARAAGLSDAQIDECTSPGSSERRIVEQDIQDAQTMGVHGTPGSFLINTKNNKVGSVPGAFSVEQVLSILKTVQ